MDGQNKHSRSRLFKRSLHELETARRHVRVKVGETQSEPADEENLFWAVSGLSRQSIT
jgi:hypothetical protein